MMMVPCRAYIFLKNEKREKRKKKKKKKKQKRDGHRPTLGPKWKREAKKWGCVTSCRDA